MSARPGPRGGYRVSGIPTAISLTALLFHHVGQFVGPQIAMGADCWRLTTKPPPAVCLFNTSLALTKRGTAAFEGLTGLRKACTFSQPTKNL